MIEDGLGRSTMVVLPAERCLMLRAGSYRATGAPSLTIGKRVVHLAESGLRVFVKQPMG